MLLKISLFFAMAVICGSNPVNTLSSDKADDKSVVNTVSDFNLALVQALSKAFKRYLPEDLVDFVHTLTNKDMKTMQTIWQEYSDDNNVSYGDILEKIKKLNPDLMARMRKFYSRVAKRIVKLPKKARMFAIKSILKFDPLLVENANENYVINAAVEVYKGFEKLRQDDQDAIIKQFPFVGEIIRARLFEEYVLKETSASMGDEQN